MDPAQGVQADLELPRVVADDDGLVQETVRRDAAPERALGGDARGIGGDVKVAKAEA